jgi:murein DD-endopeptidase MepM/ murein hydrolase activator NlpD
VEFTNLHIHPVVPFNPVNDKLIRLDFTESNKELTDEVLNDQSSFIRYINKKLTDAGARYGIGGYAEHRTVYRFSRVFDAAQPGEEPRRLHLGTDIWGKPYTPVSAPLDAIVHSFAFNNRPGDYGATIILSHRAAGISFYTLYGHLSLSSIKNIQKGQCIEQGEIFAEFGIPAENGQWPPHLHFQLIYDIGEWKGDYPGVCKYSEKEKWLANSPDPDFLLQLNQYL